jgi:hypothetical protein
MLVITKATSGSSARRVAGRRLPHDDTVAVFHPADQMWRHVLPAVGEGRVGVDQLDRPDLRGAERDRRHVRQLGLDAEAARVLVDALHAELHRQPYGRGVLGAGQRIAHRHRAVVLVAVVARLPGPAARERQAQRRVLDDVHGRVVGLQRGQVDERLEGRAGLPLRLQRAVELGVVVVAPADHRADLAGVRVHHDHRALQVRRLGARLGVARAA